MCKTDFQEVTLLCEGCLEFCINTFGSLNLFAKKTDSVAKWYFQQKASIGPAFNLAYSFSANDRKYCFWAQSLKHLTLTVGLFCFDSENIKIYTYWSIILLMQHVTAWTASFNRNSLIQLAMVHNFSLLKSCLSRERCTQTLFLLFFYTWPRTSSRYQAPKHPQALT